MKLHRLLISIVATCLLLVSARDSQGFVHEQVLELRSAPENVQPNAPLTPAYRVFHPRFYKAYGELGLNSTLYLQNSTAMPGTYVLEFHDCISGTLVFPPAPPIWIIPSGATRVAGPGDFPDLPPGCYGLVIASDRNLAYASLVEDTRSGGSATDRLATHIGYNEEEAGSRLRFGPFLKGDMNSTVHIWNISWYGSATATASVYSTSGERFDLPPCTLGPYAQCSFVVPALPQLPTRFVGVLDVQINGGSALGIMTLDSTAGDFYEYRSPLAAGAVGSCLPRTLKHVNEGGIVRSTELFVANAGSQMANANLTFYDSNGAPVAAASQSFGLAANGSGYLKLIEIPGLPDGTWSVCASGDQPLAMEELTRPDTPPVSPASSGTHQGTKLGTSESIAITHLMRNETSHTAFSVQNPGNATANVELKYYDVAGTLVHTDTVNLPPMGWARFDQSTQSGLPDGFEGSQVLTSSQPLVSLVDAYVPPNPHRIFLPLALR